MSSILPKDKLENVNFCPILLRQKFFIRFLGEWKKPKSPFKIDWPLWQDKTVNNSSNLTTLFLFIPEDIKLIHSITSYLKVILLPCVTHQTSHYFPGSWSSLWRQLISQWSNLSFAANYYKRLTCSWCNVSP